MTKFEAYFDESGTHEGAVYTFVAGFVARKSSWISFSNQWELILRKYNVNIYHSTKINSRTGEFENWTIETRNAFVDTIFKLIENESSFKSVGIGIEKQHFDMISSEFPDVHITPYMICAEQCCSYLGNLSKRNKHWLPISVYFEAGMKHDSPAFNHFEDKLRRKEFREQHRIESIDWVNKEERIQLQFADLFVYELYKRHVDSARIRTPLSRIQKHIDSFGKLLTVKDVSEYFNIYSQWMKGHGAKYL